MDSVSNTMGLPVGISMCWISVRYPTLVTFICIVNSVCMYVRMYAQIRLHIPLCGYHEQPAVGHHEDRVLLWFQICAGSYPRTICTE